MRFVLLAEGQTEKEAVGPFLKRWLDAKLAPKQVGIYVIEFGGSGHFIKEFAKQTRMASSARASATRTIGVIGLLDLLRMPGVRHETQDFSKSKWLTRRFRMFFAVHEIRGMAIKRAGDSSAIRARLHCQRENHAVPKMSTIDEPSVEVARTNCLSPSLQS